MQAYMGHRGKEKKVRRIGTGRVGFERCMLLNAMSSEETFLARQNLNRDPKEAREGAMLVSAGKHIVDTRNSMNTGCGLTACLMHFRNFRNTSQSESLHCDERWGKGRS